MNTKTIMKKTASLVLVFALFLTSICLAPPVRAEAARFKAIYPVAEKQKVGKYYIWSYDSGGDSYKVYASTSKTGKGKVIAKNILGCSDILTDGSMVYYPAKKSNAYYIYSVKMDGKNCKTVGKINSKKATLENIAAYYNGKLYLTGGYNMSYSTLCLDLKTKKWKCVQEGASPGKVSGEYQYGEYLFLGINYHAKGAGYVFNCGTQNSVKISDMPLSYGGFASGKVYFAERIGEKPYQQGYSYIRVRTCDLNGKNKKTIAKLPEGSSLEKVTSKYIYYKVYSGGMGYGGTIKYYRYNIKTKQSKKITKHAFLSYIK